MSHRRRVRISLPPLSPSEAIAVLDVLERAILAIGCAHGDQVRELRAIRQLEARARRRGRTIHNLDADPGADF